MTFDGTAGPDHKGRPVVVQEPSRPCSGGIGLLETAIHGKLVADIGQPGPVEVVVDGDPWGGSVVAGEEHPKRS